MYALPSFQQTLKQSHAVRHTGCASEGESNGFHEKLISNILSNFEKAVSRGGAENAEKEKAHNNIAINQDINLDVVNQHP
jgi:hypothetical protein